MMSWTLVKGMQLVHLRIFSLEFPTAKFLIIIRNFLQQNFQEIVFFFNFILFLNLKHCISFAKHQNEIVFLSMGQCYLLHLFSNLSSILTDERSVWMLATLPWWHSG